MQAFNYISVMFNVLNAKNAGQEVESLRYVVRSLGRRSALGMTSAMKRGQEMERRLPVRESSSLRNPPNREAFGVRRVSRRFSCWAPPNQGRLYKLLRYR